MVAASTLMGLAIAPRWGSAPVVLLYLLPVLAAAVLRGLGPALLAAITSTLAYNFFFTVPYRTLLIRSPADIVTVAVLFLVALVTSHLAGSMREHARIAEARADRNSTIAGLARRLLSRASDLEIAQVAVNELARLFDCNVLHLTGTDHTELLASTSPHIALDPSDYAAAVVTLSTGKPAGRGVKQANLADWQFHPVASDQAVIAAVGLARDDGIPPVDLEQLPLLGNLLDQTALALERARLEYEAREFATLRERDRIRSALLSSIGHDVKPRLTAIIGASRALRRAGSGDKALVSAVASEAAMLDRYIDNLVNLSPGSDQEPVEVGPITIDLYRRSVSREGAEVHLTPKEYAVLAELAKHPGRVLTHAHLLRSVWGPAQERQVEYLRVAVRALRQKLETDPAHPAIIINEPAVGYRLISPA
jgi:two-component system sensor histidine kinase KdpD